MHSFHRRSSQTSPKIVLHLKATYQPTRFNSQSAFVSKHFRSPPKELVEVLGALQAQSRIRSAGEGVLEVRECHMCDKPNKSKADNLWKLRFVKLA